jgi:hypothetical protein
MNRYRVVLYTGPTDYYGEPIPGVSTRSCRVWRAASGEALHEKILHRHPELIHADCRRIDARGRQIKWK